MNKPLPLAAGALALGVAAQAHDQAEAMALADRVAVMRDGRMEQVAPPRQLYHEPATPMVAEPNAALRLRVPGEPPAMGESVRVAVNDGWVLPTAG